MVESGQRRPGCPSKSHPQAREPSLTLPQGAPLQDPFEKKKGQTVTGAGKDVRTVEPHALLIGMSNGAATLDNHPVVPQKVHTESPAIPLLDIYPRRMNRHVHPKTCTRMLIAVFFIIAPK